MTGLPRFAFDSDAIPESQRLAFCRDEFARKVLHVEMKTVPGQPFRLRMGGDQFGLVRAGLVGIKGLKNVRNQRELADGDHQFGAVIPLAGRFACGSDGELSELRPGGVMALSNGRVGSVGSETGGIFWTILAPRDLMEPMIADGAFRYGEVRGPHAGALGTLIAYWRMTMRHGPDAPESVRSAMGRHLAELLALAFTTEAPEGRDGEARQAARLEAARTDIAGHFTDPWYDIEACSRHLGISVRYLQRLLEKDGTNFGDELRRLRLERARQMLTDPSLAHLRIIDIAIDCGFADISNFNRLFRSRFGDTPGTFRAR